TLFRSLVPLARRGEWYRYHHLFRDMLLAELESRQPDLIPVLRRRAAGWCLLNDLHEEALDYFMAAGDVPGRHEVIQCLFMQVVEQAPAGSAPPEHRNQVGLPAFQFG